MGRVIGLLNTFLETEEMLTSSILSASKYCDLILVLDGRYPNLESKYDYTPNIEEWITNLQCECEVVLSYLKADEVIKRQMLFNWGRENSNSSDDWFLNFDSDDVISGELNLNTEYNKLTSNHSDVKYYINLFKNKESIILENHSTYYYKDSLEILRFKNARLDNTTKSGLIINHQKNKRSQERKRLQQIYYTRRNKLGLEKGYGNGM